MKLSPLENTLFVGKVLVYLESVDSTNDYAKILLANSNPIHGTVILSYNQTHGRGQYGRKWENAPDESVAFSLILKDKNTSVNDQFFLNKAVALAVVNCLIGLLPKENNVRIKWPNDIMIEDKKVAGILIENSFRSSQISSTVVGIGINALQKGFPDELPHAGSLYVNGGWSGSLDDIVLLLARELERWLIKFYKGDFREIHEQFKNRLWGLNEMKNFILKNGEGISGTIIDVDKMGRIQLEQAGQNQVYSHGDIRIKL